MLHQTHTLDEYLPPIPDDTEEAPWMVVSTPQWHATDAFYNALDLHAQAYDPPWLVAALLGIRYRPNPPSPHREKLAPDVMVAFVPDADRPRTTYDVDEEGLPPAFVLEVVSPESQRRDLEVKPRRYERMGVREYALFAPPASGGVRGRRLGFGLLTPPLQGYRRDDPSSRFESWEPDESGRLYSRALDLWLLTVGETLRVQRRDGTLLPTPRELEAARRQAEAARDEADAAQRRAETEVASLRAELQRLRGTKDAPES